MNAIAKRIFSSAVIICVVHLAIVDSAYAEASTSQVNKNADTKYNLKRAKVLTITGASLTGVGWLRFLSAMGIGAVALYYLASHGAGDTAGVFGFFSLVTMAAGTPFLAAGLPLLITGNGDGNGSIEHRRISLVPSSATGRQEWQSEIWGFCGVSPFDSHAALGTFLIN